MFTDMLHPAVTEYEKMRAEKVCNTKTKDDDKYDEEDNEDDIREQSVRETIEENDNTIAGVCSSCKRMNCPCGDHCECFTFCRCVSLDVTDTMEDNVLEIADLENPSQYCYRVHLAITGLHCSSCTLTVSRALQMYLKRNISENGYNAKDILVSLENADFIVSIKKDMLNELSIDYSKAAILEEGNQVQNIIQNLAKGAVEAIEDAGFEASVINIEDLNAIYNENPYDQSNKRIFNNPKNEEIHMNNPEDDRLLVLELKPSEPIIDQKAFKKKVQDLLYSIESDFYKERGIEKNKRKAAISDIMWNIFNHGSTDESFSTVRVSNRTSTTGIWYVTVVYRPILLVTASSTSLLDTSKDENIENSLEAIKKDNKMENSRRGGLRLIIDVINESGLCHASFLPELPSSKSIDNDNAENKMMLHAKAQRKQVESKRRAFLLSLLGTFPVLIISMIFSKIDALDFIFQQSLNPSTPSFTVEAMLLWLLSTPVQFYSGKEFYVGAFRGIRNGILGMDVLIAFGTSAAYFYAVYSVSNGIYMDLKSRSNVADDVEGGMMTMSGAHFFETSAVLITFVLLGQWLQLLATRRTSMALKKLLGLQGRTAVLVTPLKVLHDDKAHSSSKNVNQPSTNTAFQFDPTVDPFHTDEIPTSLVHKGDILQIIRGSAIPADGVIISGKEK